MLRRNGAFFLILLTGSFNTISRFCCCFVMPSPSDIFSGCCFVAFHLHKLCQPEFVFQHFFNVSGEGKEKFSIVYQNNTEQAGKLISEADRQHADVIAVNPAGTLTDVIDDNYRLFHDDADLSKSFILTNNPVIRSGTVRFTPGQTASYLIVSKYGREIMIINVDFSQMTPTEESLVFKNMNEFVLEQNIPVIIVGNFGISSWKEVFSGFLRQSGMEVKNRVILSDGKSFLIHW